MIRGAGLWSAAAVVAGMVWAVTGLSFPFAVNDPRAVEAGSIFVGAEPRTAGIVVAVLGLVGVRVAVTACRNRGSRWVTGTGWALAIALLLLVPDVRMIQNVAYLFFGFVGELDMATLWMLAAIGGGVLWASVAVANATATEPDSSGTDLRSTRKSGLRCGPSRDGAARDDHSCGARAAVPCGAHCGRSGCRWVCPPPTSTTRT